eukprot:365621-Chlamydomonas_euryale.AAC.14
MWCGRVRMPATSVPTGPAAAWQAGQPRCHVSHVKCNTASAGLSVRHRGCIIEQPLGRGS